jgi:hypothetical protein
LLHHLLDPRRHLITSGENAQDNDLIVIRDAAAAAKFEVHFERMWDAAELMIEFGPAINALEPR